MMATVDFWASVYRDAVSAVDIRGSTNRGEKHISPFILLSTKWIEALTRLMCHNSKSGIHDSLREIAKMLVPFEKKESSRIHDWNWEPGTEIGNFPFAKFKKSNRSQDSRQSQSGYSSIAVRILANRSQDTRQSQSG